MRINNNSYTDILMRDEIILKYSRTAQTLKAEIPKSFDAVFADVAAKRMIKPLGRDTVILEAGQRFSQAKNISGHYDSVLTGHSRDEEFA